MCMPGAGPGKVHTQGQSRAGGWGLGRLPTLAAGLLSLTADMLWILAVLSMVSFGTPGMWDTTHWGPPHENPDVAGIGLQRHSPPPDSRWLETQGSCFLSWLNAQG